MLDLIFHADVRLLDTTLSHDALYMMHLIKKCSATDVKIYMTQNVQSKI